MRIADFCCNFDVIVDNEQWKAAQVEVNGYA
jgi:hypothetical protein